MPFIELRMEVRGDMSQLGPIAERRVRQVLQKSARDIEARAKTVVPVDTGALKNSIQARAASDRPLTWEVTVGKQYGVYVEFGTYRMAARAFLTPAFEAVRPMFEAAMAQVLNEAAQEGSV